jgi:histidinol-phosphate aminotransferase
MDRWRLDPLRRIRSDVRALHAYAVQDATGLVKLDAMENPYPLPPALQDALGRRLGALAIHRYPGARIEELKRALARHIGLPDGHALMLGNGSDELIMLLALACDLPGAAILAPEPSFVMYAMSARLAGLAWHGVPLTADFALDDEAMVEAVRRYRPAITYLAYPNNPTANGWSATAMRRVIAAAAEVGGLVVVDEAYQPFSGHTWLDEMRAAPNAHNHVLLLRTLSKLGLAGARLGYLVGPQALVHEIDKLRPPYNVSVLNAECALFALEHADVLGGQARRICEERQRLSLALAAMAGLQVFPSDANMVLVRVPDADACFEGLRWRGILVKNVSTMHPLLANCLRLTVGTPEENDRLLAALRSSL